MEFDTPKQQYKVQRTTPDYGIKYFVRERDISGYTDAQKLNLDKVAQNIRLEDLNIGCERERRQQQRMREDAMGWFSQDEEKMKQASDMVMENCGKLALLAKNKKTK